MNRHRMHCIPMVALAAIATVSVANPTRAEDRGSWVKNLTMPHSTVSCCDISDCRKAEADWHDGQWWATVNGQWTPIPHDRELDKRSIDGSAYVCASPTNRIFCFVRPDTMM